MIKKIDGRDIRFDAENEIKYRVQTMMMLNRMAVFAEESHRGQMEELAKINKRLDHPMYAVKVGSAKQGHHFSQEALNPMSELEQLEKLQRDNKQLKEELAINKLAFGRAIDEIRGAAVFLHSFFGVTDKCAKCLYGIKSLECVACIREILINKAKEYIKNER